VSRTVSRLRALAVRAASAIASGEPTREHRALDLIEAVLAATALEAEGAEERSA
jgi:hypothetical protein